MVKTMNFWSNPLKNNRINTLEKFDTDLVNAHVFHPRHQEPMNNGIKRLFIEVCEGVKIGASFFEAEKNAPFILYFHGNGEIVPDYDDLGIIFIENNINFMPVDYRGYGFSNGNPSLSNLLHDAVKISDFAFDFRDKNGFTGAFAVMGRSLGSASAIEATDKRNYFDAMIIESGFASFKKLLRTLGFYDNDLDQLEDPLLNDDKIKSFVKSLLIIHGKQDQIIPFSQGKLLFESSESKVKKLVEIKNAGHNTIFTYGLDLYFNSIKNLFENM